jgi:hypothetical protein
MAPPARGDCEIAGHAPIRCRRCDVAYRVDGDAGAGEAERLPVLVACPACHAVNGAHVSRRAVLTRTYRAVRLAR